MASFCCRHEMVEEKFSFDEIFCSTSQMKEQVNALIKAWECPMNTLTISFIFTLQYTTGFKKKKEKAVNPFSLATSSGLLKWNEMILYASNPFLEVRWHETIAMSTSLNM